MCATWCNVLTLCVIWVGDWWLRWTVLSIHPSSCIEQSGFWRLLPSANESLGQGNIFTGVCLSTGGSLYDVTSCLAAWFHVPFRAVSFFDPKGWSLSRGSLSRGGLSPEAGGLCQGDPPKQRPPPWWRVGGMHPTGMLSCFDVSFLNICKLNRVTSVGLSTSHGLFTLHGTVDSTGTIGNKRSWSLFVVPFLVQFPFLVPSNAYYQLYSVWTDSTPITSWKSMLVRGSAAIYSAQTSAGVLFKGEFELSILQWLCEKTNVMNGVST